MYISEITEWTLHICFIYDHQKKKNSWKYFFWEGSKTEDNTYNNQECPLSKVSTIAKMENVKIFYPKSSTWAVLSNLDTVFSNCFPARKMEIHSSNCLCSRTIYVVWRFNMLKDMDMPHRCSLNHPSSALSVTTKLKLPIKMYPNFQPW